eukprot:1449636-Rhodomonas_salina.1
MKRAARSIAVNVLNDLCLVSMRLLTSCHGLCAGDKCVVLYDYFAESSAPFPPDTRRELTVTKVRKARSCKCEALGDLTVFLGRGQDWTSLRRDLTDGAWFENQGEPR